MPLKGIEVKGLAELRALIRQAGDAGLTKALLTANKNAASTVVDIATPLTPRRHGDLRHSLRAAATAKRGTVKSSLPYSAAIHWGRGVGNVGSPPGNRKGPNAIKGRPFIYLAVKTGWPQVVRQYEVEIGDLVATINRGAR